MGARINHPRTVVDRTLHHDVEAAHPAALVDVGWDFRGPGAKAEEQHRPLRVVRARRPRGTPRDRNGDYLATVEDTSIVNAKLMIWDG